MKSILSLALAFVVAGTLCAADYKLDGSNTTINWKGTKKGGEHTGSFKTISGTISGDDAKSIKLNVTIDTTSLTSDDDKLTAHLKSPDFFECKEYPSATFTSTKIAKGDKDGEYTITGDLTIRGKKKEINFPATIAMTEGSITLKADFAIDRTDYGMTYGAGKIDNKVSLSVKVEVKK
jgi:polyisoprenoid-binding protein YceI